ncbi:hypothetical protein N7466_007317 [Penicillium verhagenii]|uniref:uncharacterized protein n=1 Tax=Penicillium verhagenii TaxID=1562060 RepID=UPI0025455510|nr:uncharacterized protein N7466_007317 [Penicillium verhagenii]KAJ5928361.1 hypothetical protein N7466_007317 [Penicillium verhagenii]
MANSQLLSSTEREQYDLVTQESVIMRIGMPTVIEDYRDAVTTTIDRRKLVDLVSKLHASSESLRWSLFFLETCSSSDSVKCNTARRLAAQNVHEFVVHLDRTVNQIEDWVLGAE